MHQSPSFVTPSFVTPSFVTLSFEGVDSADQVNRITTALMMLDGVDSVEVGRHGADVEGTATREALVRAVKSLELPITIS